MVESWSSFLLIYLLIAAIPTVILAIRGQGWRPRFFVASVLLAWTGGGWVVMLWIAMLEKPAGASLYMGSNKVERN